MVKTCWLRLRRTQGFTLAEAMVVVAIIGVLSVMIGPTMLDQGTRYFILSQTKLQLQMEARNAISLITRNLRQAQSNSIRIDQLVNQPYYSRITFTKIQGYPMSYYQSGTTLIQLSSGTVTNTLSKNLQYLAFTFPHSDDMTIVSVSLTLQQNIYQGRVKALHMASEKVQVMN